ncbi:carboxypeptidase regulatory-like domain-containing protein [Pseudenhygromyxa sp. WMMC2535]|uniref:carboxypeptidase-like regulatory domain-containing protein n=1 Tax=Pseudenhygromyxa sp. WMMC2535 TaxID=2712867 RepID=UPI001552DAF7|nr:carboxypeptidase-like regulatory domain-containing protein [Pseudenhygromyxa sp. WMMC2535]NVB38983.1 carboxypeptidase regulatory-like domain-containing protein [Pseudenhygromyxa sp. WMMC2535]
MTTLAKYQISSLALAFGLSLVAACGGDKAGEANNKDKDADAKEEGADKQADKKTDEKADAAAGDAAAGGEQAAGDAAAGDAPPANPGEAGPAYFAVNNKGIAKLDGGAWSLISSEENRYVSDMFTGPDGAVYVLDYNGLHKINGDKIEKVVDFGYKDIGTASHVAMAKGGDLWATNYKGVGHYTGGAWTLTEKEKIGEGGVDMLTDVAVDAGGTPWVSGSKVVLKFADDKWSNVDLSMLGDNPYLFRLGTSPSGDVYGQTSREIIKFSGDKAEKIEINSKNFMGYGAAMEFGPSGQVAVSSSLCDVARLDPAKPEEVWLLSKEDVDCLSFQALALDGQNRVWLASREGLSVIGSDKKATEYGTGTVMELVGTVSHVAVVGAGPTLPAVGDAHTGGITGKVLMDGSAIASAKIEMCPSPQIFGTGSPCSTSKVKFEGSTNEKGEFTFETVPLGDYNIAVEIDGKWRSNYIPSFATKMKEGQTYDVGSVTYSKM